MPAPPDRPVRCLHYVRELTLEAGGVVRAVLDLCATLAKRGHEITLVTPRADDAPDSWREPSPGQPRLISVSDELRAGRRLSRGGIEQITSLMKTADVVHLHTPWEPSNLQLARQAVRQQVPYVVTVHGMLDEWVMAQKNLKKRVFLSIGGRQFLEQAAAVHFTAEAERDQGLHWIPRAADHACVVPLIFDVSPYQRLVSKNTARAELQLSDVERPLILFLSRLHIKKGVELLIDATAHLRDEGCDVDVVLAGPGDDSYLRELASRVSQRRLTDRIKFTGMVRGDQKSALYRAADLFVLPTHQENFGIVLVEALASGTPVVTTRGTDIWQELRDAGAQIVPHDAGHIAATIKRLVSSRTALEELGQRGRRYVLDWLSEAKVASRYEELYRSVI